MVTEAPAVVIVTDDVGRVVVGRLSESEYHAAVVAMLLTSTVWSPRVVPSAAVAVT